jgi:uncharacterized membrane protein YeaQ/YmgE (transglycosylase-associated protein family)
VINFRSEKFLHWWASITVIILGLVVMVPRGVMPPTSELPIWIQFIGGVVGAIAATFYLRMLHECIFRSSISRRALWVVFFLVMPIFSSIVYFMTTRSVIYQAPSGPPST